MNLKSNELKSNELQNNDELTYPYNIYIPMASLLEIILHL